MGRRILCVHTDPAVQTRVASALPRSVAVQAVRDVAAGEARHARTPYDVVLVQLRPGAAVVRAVRSWHPCPAIVAVTGGGDAAVEVALGAGAHDHLHLDALDHTLTAAVEHAWRRHRAERTRRAERRPHPDVGGVRDRIGQLVSLTTAAKDLLDVDEPPHPTVRSLLDQVRELGQETMERAGEPWPVGARTRLELAPLVASAWEGRSTNGTVLDLDVDRTPVEVHGHAPMLRTALAVLLAHALRGIDPTDRVRVDTEVLEHAVRVRVHDAGPPVALHHRRALFTGDDDRSPSLVAVQHVAARHGGAAWVADSDVLEDGTMAVLELPVRALPR